MYRYVETFMENWYTKYSLKFDCLALCPNIGTRRVYTYNSSEISQYSFDHKLNYFICLASFLTNVYTCCLYTCLFARVSQSWLCKSAIIVQANSCNLNYTYTTCIGTCKVVQHNYFHLLLVMGSTESQLNIIIGFSVSLCLVNKP